MKVVIGLCHDFKHEFSYLSESADYKLASLRSHHGCFVRLSCLHLRGHMTPRIKLPTPKNAELYTVCPALTVTSNMWVRLAVPWEPGLKTTLDLGLL